MAGANAIHNTKHQKLTSDQKKQQQDPNNKFYHHFLYKAAVVAIFLVILPLFPSQAPEFINQSLLTRSWELLHLLLVGIAISYGLFSRRNDETDKENISKFDNAQTLVSRFLQVSSFFEDEAENSSSESDETKVQTWNNQHYRNEPVVVVAPHEDQGGGVAAKACSRIVEKPLLLPVRSLKSRLSDDVDDVQYVNESSNINSFSLNRSNSKTCSKRFSCNSSKARNGELEGHGDHAKVENKMKNNVVLPSPIPWRSRSGRLEPKLEVDIPNKQHASKPSMEESEFNKMESRLVKSQPSRSSQTSPLSSSPKFTPSLPLFSSESLAKNGENLIRKKGFYKPCPPPPPPPPPMFQKSISMKPRYGSFNEGASSFDKELKRSFSSDQTNGMNMKRFESGIEVKPRGYAENMSMGKSVRTVRGGQNQALFLRGREIGKEEMMEKEELEDEEHFMEEPTRKGMGYEHMSFRTDQFKGHTSVPLVSQPASMEFAEEEKESFLDKVIVESDDEDTESEDEDVGGRIIQKDSGESPLQNGEISKTDNGASGSIGDEGPDVDKQADEFIAKFREQIRLQRIESIKRSTTKITGNSSREGKLFCLYFLV